MTEQLEAATAEKTRLEELLRQAHAGSADEELELQVETLEEAVEEIRTENEALKVSLDDLTNKYQESVAVAVRCDSPFRFVASSVLSPLFAGVQQEAAGDRHHRASA